MNAIPGIDVSIPPSGTGCVECDAGGGWWLHLRRCAECGHIGCCDNSPAQHATAHEQSTGHPIIRSFEPGEDWFFHYPSASFFDGPELAPPAHRPLDQGAPGPASRVPKDWQHRLHG
jgi:Zn-finger in ubiquitin-hydrolases and other protein